jgi:hypothetical protein
LVHAICEAGGNSVTFPPDGRKMAAAGFHAALGHTGVVSAAPDRFERVLPNPRDGVRKTHPSPLM